MNAQHIIDHLNMQPHPEGGYYKEMYRSAAIMETAENRKRNVCTAIYYLLQNKDRSHFHRIASDELWFFHSGSTIEIFSIRENKLESQLLGNDWENGETMQICIPAHTWFAAHLQSENGYALVSCTVAPGFDFEDFELAKQAELLETYPHLENIVKQFTA